MSEYPYLFRALSTEFNSLAGILLSLKLGLVVLHIPIIPLQPIMAPTFGTIFQMQWFGPCRTFLSIQMHQGKATG